MNTVSKLEAREKSECFEDREFPMTDGDFVRIKKMAYDLSGINLSDHKKNMIYGRLARRLRKLSIANFKDYCDLVQDEHSDELGNFVNSITTNLTSFFREEHHFEFLKTTVFPNLLNSNKASKRIRIWSAGCSTGEEPYSIAMVVKKFTAFANWDVKILATDLDSNVVAKAKSGMYAADRVERVPSDYEKYLQLSKDKTSVRIHPDVAALITFKTLNLLHQWPMKGPFDVIFCRNVVIYFDAQTQRVLFDRYANLLAENAHLFIGHSENLHNISDRFSSKGRTIYQKHK